MSTTRDDIQRWFEEGMKKPDTTHMIIVCDTFDYDDYPVFVKNDRDVRKVEEEYNNKSMQRVMEVYCLSEDMEMQLSLGRCFCYEPRSAAPSSPPEPSLPKNPDISNN